jgi:hypothetical protein
VSGQPLGCVPSSPVSRDSASQRCLRKEGTKTPNQVCWTRGERQGTRTPEARGSELGARVTILELGARDSALAFRRVSELGHGALRTSVRLTQDAGRMGFLRQPNTRVCALPNVLADPDPGRGLVSSDVRSQDKRRAPRTCEARARLAGSRAARTESRARVSCTETRGPSSEARRKASAESRAPSSSIVARDPSSETRVLEPRAPSVRVPCRSPRARGSRA